MNTPRTLAIALALLCPAAAIMTSGCSKSENSKVSDAYNDTKTAVKDAALELKVAALSAWDRVRDATFDRRSEFSAGLDDAITRMDARVTEKKAALKPDTPERARAIRDYDQARAELRDRMIDLANCTADTWGDAKAQASRAWGRVETAYERALN